ncbi:tyrosine-type recombinase/integrase [Mucilaginibacter pedocola]|uniref:Tyr recombinase domain-containing protein n=1 Tax=Mucilaginibacter pedocola TaxID=1792845 RepID=A0A1S9PNP5_9SPHI|nr:integrase arm-type DNA-binding domain-containing protein [Mucilaginibacter pedocola]OOQ62188.1 hypothetical protein BC343_03855 [Mucilaginibacter pedocola]
MPLNDLQCRNAKPQPNKYRLYDDGGLYLEVMPNGSKYWRYKYRIDGKEKRLALGIYPEVPLMQARNLQEVAKKQKQKGFDPVFLKLADKQRAKDDRSQTLEVLGREWYELNRAKWKPGFAREVLKRLENHLFPKLGRFPMRQLTTGELYDCIKGIEQKAPHMAKRCRQYLSQIFCFGVQTDRAERDITIELKGAITTPKVKHRRSMDIDELPAFLKVLESRKDEISPVAYYAVRIMLKTFVRRTELMTAGWCEFDFDNAMWTVTALRMKMQREHLVPLSRQVIADLKALHALTGHTPYLFPSLIARGEFTSMSLIQESLITLDYGDKMSCHGFRALAMGVCKEKLKYQHEIPDRQLAHVPQSEIDRAYDRAKYLDERTEMMQRYADYLDQQLRTTPSPTDTQQRTIYHHDYRPQQPTYATIQYASQPASFRVLAASFDPQIPGQSG